jgi:hypothetical protein
MACPFFAPQRRLDPGAWTHRPRLPLGDPCFGFCHALSGTSFAPPEEHQRELCNRGYARGLCAHFPVSDAADAVRFSVAGDRGGYVRVVYVFEKDHAPLTHGALEFQATDLQTGDFPAGAAAPADDLLLRQARAFVESYLKSVADSKIPAQ